MAVWFCWWGGAKLFFPEERPQMLADYIRVFWTEKVPVAATA